MRDLEYRLNGKMLDIYAGARMVAAAFAGGKPSDVLHLWVDDYEDEARAERVAELKDSSWFKNLMHGTRE